MLEQLACYTMCVAGVEGLVEAVKVPQSRRPPCGGTTPSSNVLLSPSTGPLRIALFAGLLKDYPFFSHL